MDCEQAVAGGKAGEDLAGAVMRTLADSGRLCGGLASGGVNGRLVTPREQIAESAGNAEVGGIGVVHFGQCTEQRQVARRGRVMEDVFRRDVGRKGARIASFRHNNISPGLTVSSGNFWNQIGTKA